MVSKPTRHLAVVLLSLALLGTGQMQPSATLTQILLKIAHFDDGSRIAVSYWASYPNPQAPDMTLTDLDDVETKILTLAPAEREALDTWLTHGGRAKLYVLGITDGDIGPCQPLIDPKTCRNSPTLGLAQTNPLASAPSFSTSGEQRDLAFSTSSDASAASGITVERGFAVVNPDAGTLTHCVTFRNTTQKTVAALTLSYKVLAQSGGVLTAGSDILVGSFTAGEESAGPTSFSELQSMQSSGHGPPSNCWIRSSGAQDPLLQRASRFAIAVGSVTYEDGTHWSL